jgi:hypothetical protein
MTTLSLFQYQKNLHFLWTEALYQTCHLEGSKILGQYGQINQEADLLKPRQMRLQLLSHILAKIYQKFYIFEDKIFCY